MRPVETLVALILFLSTGLALGVSIGRDQACNATCADLHMIAGERKGPVCDCLDAVSERETRPQQ